ncbi:hypothetical protein [Hymenobacter sp. YC55]|uniref:hypothetical protein n=1 Tax=Hymenobacter sp. YC55 TaxID=3034019 RepID=UPI0023F9AAB0|nr:hypothetical protein [Hymenobacter sp. YC55]MDF7815380.1 hypothetical protein [Hymenobacter sp. YC55]
MQCGAAEDSLHELAAAGMRFDSVFLDLSYYSVALVGGRGIADYDFIQVPEFARVMHAVYALARPPTSHVYLMLSGAPSARRDMACYLATLRPPRSRAGSGPGAAAVTNQLRGSRRGRTGGVGDELSGAAALDKQRLRD